MARTRARTEPRHIALYGSLRRGESAYAGLRLDKLLRYQGPCRLAGILYDLGDYPGIVAGTGIVQGELFEIAARHALDILDAFEECDARNPHMGLYRREAVTLAAPRTRAWVYLYNCPVDAAAHIETGDWVAWRRAKGTMRA
jgi:gamma-glutamylcyclotransferase (GGCT)/AIG2-like uncharacterized protein YtfP